MSQEIGSTLPPPLRFELGAHPIGEVASAIVLITCDAGGAPRIALLAPAEIAVRDESHVSIKARTGSSTCANLVRNGQAALWCVLDAAAYCIRGSVARGPSSESDGEFETFELAVLSVLRDFSPDAPMVSGPTYRRLH